MRCILAVCSCTAFLFALPLAAEPSAPSAASSTRERPVTLRFGWPVGLSARVTHTWVVRDGAGRKQLDEGRRYRMTVEETRNGLRRLVPSEIEEKSFASRIALDSLDTVLFDREGAFMGIQLPEEGGLSHELSTAVPTSPEKQEELSQQINALQQSAARARWESLVGRWRNLTLVPGQPILRKVKMGLGSMLERVEVEANERMTLESDVPCTPKDVQQQCVRIAIMTEPTTRYVASKDSGDASSRWPMRMKSSQSRQRFELVVRPDTLIPYSAFTLREDTIERDRDDGTPFTERYVQIEEYLFDYGIGDLQPAKTQPISL